MKLFEIVYYLFIGFLCGMLVSTSFSPVSAQEQMPLDTMQLVNCRGSFGMVRRYSSGKPKAHQGWDLKAEIGSNIYAVATGSLEKGFHSDYGTWAMIRSYKSSYYYFYAHLQSVIDSNQVKVGDVIGKVGRTGNVPLISPTHLHFEMRTQKRPGLGLKGRLSPSVGIRWNHNCKVDYNNLSLSLSSRR